VLSVEEQEDDDEEEDDDEGGAAAATHLSFKRRRSGAKVLPCTREERNANGS